MCLGAVVRVVEVGVEGRAIVEHAAVEHGAVEHGAANSAGRREAVLDMTDENLRPGDWVVIHSGFALERISEARAIDALAIRATSPDNTSPDNTDLNNLSLDNTNPAPAASAAPNHQEMAP